jgi:hypothetical protein
LRLSDRDHATGDKLGAAGHFRCVRRVPSPAHAIFGVLRSQQRDDTARAFRIAGSVKDGADGNQSSQGTYSNIIPTN